MKVKICANKSIEDAKNCIESGVDIIGVLVGQEHASVDFIDKETAKEICDFVDKRCDISLVTHLKNSEEIIELAKFIGNNVIQLHSDIDENEVENIKKSLPNVKLVRLVHISNDGEIVTNIDSIKYADYYLLDIPVFILCNYLLYKLYHKNILYTNYFFALLTKFFIFSLSLYPNSFLHPLLTSTP